MPSDIDDLFIEDSKDSARSSRWITNALYYEDDPRILQSWIVDRSLALGQGDGDSLAKANKLGEDLFRSFRAFGTPIAEEVQKSLKAGVQIAVVPANEANGLSRHEVTALGIGRVGEQLSDLGFQFARIPTRPPLNRSSEENTTTLGSN